MKRIKTKLLIVVLLALGTFSYQYFTSIGDSDIKKAAQQRVEKKLASTESVIFDNVKIAQKNQYKEGESYRVCGLYRLASQTEFLPFVANIDVQSGAFSEHDQLLVSETPEIKLAIDNLCQDTDKKS
ncbi:MULTISPECIES: hypothetical protein [unclassified Providencia]|uniref:hypothetical protein n=1 Tax=unclassified Providencia TaxID=2633465 RepID=UPI000E823964|nr:hypothetical protein [Providencia sp.]MBP6080567.1 hypothetical protein [Providencia sp.]HBO22831.1 hypothetical protein [Providencia sp.]